MEKKAQLSALKLIVVLMITKKAQLMIFWAGVDEVV